MDCLFSCCKNGQYTDNRQDDSAILSTNHPLYSNAKLKKLIAGVTIYNQKEADLTNINMPDTPLTSIFMSKDIIYQGKVINGRAHDTHGVIIYPDGSFY